ncbi:MAG: 4Fe-4S dicluster domain-containing protein [Planctomycetota bacterium]
MLKITEKTTDREFVRQLEEISGENFHTCMQCGTCSGGCPVVDDMDLSPRLIMGLAHLGIRNRILEANTAWLCATCETCHVRCPRGLDIPRLMEAIRQISLRTNQNHVEPNALTREVLRDAPQIALVSCFRKHTS